MKETARIATVIALFLLITGIVLYWNDYYMSDTSEEGLSEEQRQWLKENYYPQKEKQQHCEAIYNKCLEESI